MSKQDRQGVRTPADLERKYNFGERFSSSGVSDEQLASRLNKLATSFAQYVANTNATIAELEEQQSVIVLEAKGARIILLDSSEKKLKGLMFYGKTTQNGTPTKENPIDLVSIGESGSIRLTLTDGSDTQIMTVITGEGLCGIKVTEGGNYTDANGDRWICDEIDFARGMFIQRIGYIDYFDKSDDSFDVFMSTTGECSLGATVIYPLAEPVEVALTVSEMSDYAELHTYCPNTTISNNAECGMKVVYVADIKTYIDNKIAEGGG